MAWLIPRLRQIAAGAGPARRPAPRCRAATLAAVLLAAALTGCAGQSGAEPATATPVARDLAAASSPEPAPTPEPAAATPSLTPVPLRQAAPFPVGVAVQWGRLVNEPYRQVAGSVFSSLTASYEMKMGFVAGSRDFYRWGVVDALVGFAEANQMQVHGHTLVWHQSTPAWLEDFSGSDAEFEALVRDYITAMVGRYRGRITSWDVVNEALAPQTGRLRDTVFRRRMGEDYVARLFEYAHAADPDALLFYNDFGMAADDAKLAAMLAMVDDLQRRGVPIHGVGLQMHVTYAYPRIGRIKTAMNELVRRGLLVHISELDVRANPGGELTELPPERSQAQRRRVRDIVEAFLALPAENRFAITVWGLRDSDSWLINFWGNPDWPLLFDRDFEPKPAYTGFLQALQAG